MAMCTHNLHGMYTHANGVGPEGPLVGQRSARICAASLSRANLRLTSSTIVQLVQRRVGPGKTRGIPLVIASMDWPSCSRWKYAISLGHSTEMLTVLQIS